LAATYYADFNPRSMRNFHMEANGAEMLRLACCLGTENGIQVCGPVHDAVLIMAPIARLGADVTRMLKYMEQASAIVLKGFPLRSEAKLINYPDQQGTEMWNKVMSLL
jgi:DNA polymerase I